MTNINRQGFSVINGVDQLLEDIYPFMQSYTKNEELAVEGENQLPSMTKESLNKIMVRKRKRG